MHESQTIQERENASPVRWRVTTTNGVRFACLVSISGARVEVQLTTGHDSVLCASVVSSLDAADGLAHRWLRALVAGDDVSELIAGSRADTVH